MLVKKTVFKDGLNDLRQVIARQECVIQSELDHPNIVKLHKYHESEKNLELVMDFCNHGSYFEDRLEDVRLLHTSSRKSWGEFSFT